MKHYRVANRTRFICFLTLVCILACFIFLGAVNKSAAAGKESYTEFVVKEGDTLWDIAKSCGNPHEDIRETIYRICSINDIKAEDLRPGQVILVPEE